MLHFPFDIIKEMQNLLGVVSPPICTENFTTLLDVLLAVLISKCVKNTFIINLCVLII
jgi:hypothetical protein